MAVLRRSVGPLLLTGLAVLCLGYDAYVHLHLAGTYDAVGGTVTQGALFRLEAAAALLAIVILLLSDSRPAWALAGAVGLGGAVAVVLYRYVDVPALGPIPAMYEPVWYAEKLWSAGAEAIVGVAWLLRESVRPGRRNTVAWSGPAGRAARLRPGGSPRRLADRHLRR